MKKTILGALPILSVLSVFLFASPSEAFSQMHCGDRTKGIEQLKNKYSEEPVSMGLSSQGEVIELFKSKDGSFSILTTRPDGLSCLVISGEHWEETPKIQDIGAES